MSVPRSAASRATEGARRNHARRGGTVNQADPEFREAMRQAVATCTAADMQIGHNKLIRLVKAFLATRATNQEFSSWVTTYADPTGETAVFNVLTGRGGQQRGRP